jgi:hypothetical protein
MNKLGQFTNDKNMVIIAVTVISCWAMASFGVQAKDVVIPAISGLMGIAVGQAVK